MEALCESCHRIITCSLCKVQNDVLCGGYACDLESVPKL